MKPFSSLKWYSKKVRDRDVDKKVREKKMINYQPKIDRKLNIEEKREIKKSIENSLVEILGDVVSWVYKKDVEQWMEQCKSTYDVKDVITKLEKEVKPSFGKFPDLSKKIKSNIGYGIYEAVEIKSE